MAAEARVMEYVRSCGYPVPSVEELSDDGLDMVMERVDGADMVATMTRRPWTIAHQGRVLADLHQRLHDLPAPAWLPDAPVGRGDRLIHLDLHPLNVILSPKGPIVIDWTNARRGDPAVDTSRVIGAILGRARSLLLKNFLEPFDLNAVNGSLRDVVAWKVKDPHMSAAEQAGMWKVVEKVERISS
jgi:aminoglycoside phosphotransferase (APT) family kinase protein